MKRNESTPARRLVESAIMLAVATVLSLFKLADLPYGGSVTIASMLPVIIIAYRHGTIWGLITGVVYGVIQQLLGLNTLSYVTTFLSIVAVILLDYVVAFASTGLGGVFRSKMPQPFALLFGTLLVGIVRYICHVISGATVWAGLSIPTEAALVYSLGYNATYMIPETIVTMIAAYYIGTVLDFGGTEVTRYTAKKETARPVLKWVAGLVLAGGLIAVTTLVFSKLQNAESGFFDIRGLHDVNWIIVAVIGGAAVVLSAVLFIAAAVKPKKA